MAKIEKKKPLLKAHNPLGKNSSILDNAALNPVQKNEPIFLFSVLAAYFIIGLIGVFHHEMWRDELQTWLVAAASNNFSEFCHNMKTECNPWMWYSINFIISRFTDSPVIAQIAHLLVSTGSVYLILKYAPFSRLQKVLLSFSYFILFEYSLIARGYALTVFFTFLFCAFYQIKSKNRYLILSLILFFLPNTTGLHGVILTISLLAMMIADYYFSEDTSLRKKYKPTQLFTGVIVALIGIYIAVKCIAPVANSDRSNTWFTTIDTHRVSIALRAFWMSYLPIPNFTTINFWNSNYFFQSTTSSVTYTILLLISIAIFSYCVLLYSKKLSIAVLYLAATCGILLVCYTNNVIYTLLAVRHYGFMFITFIAAAWLAPYVKKSTFIIPELNSLSNKLKLEKNFTYLLTGLLAVNMLGGAIAYGKDYTLPFSEIKAAADYIITQHLNNLPETGFIDYAVSPICAYTKQPMYFPDRDTTGRFTTWGISRYSFDLNVVFPRIANFVSHQKDSVLFISTGDYFGIGEGKVINNIQFTRLVSFTGGVVADEDYILYIVKRFDLIKQLQDSNSYHNPGAVNTILSSGHDLLQQGKLDEAEKVFKTIKDKTHGMPVAHLHNYLGMIYAKKNMTGDAEKEFNTEISLNLQKEEAFFNLGMLYFQSKDYPNAIKSWDSTIGINPKNADALNNLGVSFLNFKGDNAMAKSCFEKVVALNPSYTQAYYNLLACAQNMKDEASLIKYTRILLGKGISISDIRAKGINISDALLQKINSN